MSGRPLRAGVVGLGWAGQQHMSAYAELPGVELVALAGRETDRLAELGQQFAVPSDQRFVDWPDLLASADLDVLSIAAPTTLHASIAVAALDLGVHVLSEKPLAESAAAGERMVQAAERNHRVLDVSFNHRRRGVIKALKQLLDGGSLGPIYYAKVGWVRRQGIPTMGSWFTRRATAGGGPLMDLGVHMLDIVLYLLDEPTVRYRHRGHVRGVRAARARRLRLLDHAEDRGVRRRLRRRGPVHRVPTAVRRHDAAARVQLGPVGARGPVLRHRVRRRRRREHHLGPGHAAAIDAGVDRARRTPQTPPPDLPPDGEHLETVADFLGLVRSGRPNHGRRC